MHYASGNDFPFVALEKRLHIALHTNTGGLLRIMEYTIASQYLVRMQGTVIALWMAMAMQVTWNFPVW